jgi:hypothetical protein
MSAHRAPLVPPGVHDAQCSVCSRSDIIASSSKFPPVLFAAEPSALDTKIHDGTFRHSNRGPSPLQYEPLSGVTTPAGTGTQARVPRENQTSAVVKAHLV